MNIITKEHMNKRTYEHKNKLFLSFYVSQFLCFSVSRFLSSSVSKFFSSSVSKFFSYSVLTFLGFYVFKFLNLPSNVALAAEQLKTLELDNPFKNKNWNTLDVFFKGLVPIIIGIATIVFVVMILVSGYYFLISAGDEQKSTKAKKSLVGAVIGLIVVGVGYLAIMWGYNKLMK